MAAEGDADYKTLHEAFVSNHEGTSLTEIAVVVSTAPAGVFLRKCLIAAIYGGCHPPKSISFIIDFITLIVPVFLCFTVMADHASSLLLSMFLGCLPLLLVQHFSQSSTSAKTDSTKPCSILTEGKSPFISHFRAYVNVAAAISILAVDFTIFPRRFCKAETYGSGLMDIGVGAFVVANGIVAPEARGKWPDTSSLKQKLHHIKRSIVSTLPLWILGFVRLAVVKAVNYHEHASEYGIHWNFFFTLAIVRVLSTVVFCFVNVRWSGFLAFCIAVGYQYLLCAWGLREFVLHGDDGQDSREGIINANREGIFSCLGYLAIYFASVQLGKFLLQKRDDFHSWCRVFLVLIAMDVVFWLLLHWSQSYVEPISRRMANLSYVLWMMAYNLQLIPCFLLVDIALASLKSCSILPDIKSSTGRHFCLLEAINRNALFYFLLVNVLTGMVNMSMSTIQATTLEGLIVMTLYLFFLSVIIAVLHAYEINLKIW